MIGKGKVEITSYVVNPGGVQRVSQATQTISSPNEPSQTDIQLSPCGKHAAVLVSSLVGGGTCCVVLNLQENTISFQEQIRLLKDIVDWSSDGASLALTELYMSETESGMLETRLINLSTGTSSYNALAKDCMLASWQGDIMLLNHFLRGHPGVSQITYLTNDGLMLQPWQVGIQMLLSFTTLSRAGGEPLGGISCELRLRE